MKTPHFRQTPVPGPDCADFAPLVPLLRLGELDRREAAVLLDHLKTCAWCRRELEAHDVVDAGLRRHFAGRIALPFVSMEDVMRMSNAPPRRQSGRPLRRVASLVVALAAVVVIALLANVLFASRSAQPGIIQRPTATIGTLASPTATPTLPCGSGGPITATTRITSIAMLSAQEGWAVGFDQSNPADFNPPGVIAHFTQGHWCVWAQPGGSTLPSLAGISMVSPTLGWAVGNTGSAGRIGAIYAFDGTKWKPQHIPTSCTLDTIQMLSATDGWAGGDGCIMRFASGQWQLAFRVAYRVTSISMVSAIEGWAAAASGTSGDNPGSPVMVHIIGGQAAPVTFAPPPNLSAGSYQVNYSMVSVFMLSATDGWATGSAQILIPGADTGAYDVLLHLINGVWQETPLPGDDVGGLGNISLVSPTEGWAVGNTFLHYHSGTWSDVAAPPNIQPQQIFMVSATEGWATGQQLPTGSGPIAPVLLHYHNGAWSVFANP